MTIKYFSFKKRYSLDVWVTLYIVGLLIHPISFIYNFEDIFASQTLSQIVIWFLVYTVLLFILDFVVFAYFGYLVVKLVINRLPFWFLLVGLYMTSLVARFHVILLLLQLTSQTSILLGALVVLVSLVWVGWIISLFQTMNVIASYIEIRELSGEENQPILFRVLSILTFLLSIFLLSTPAIYLVLTNGNNKYSETKF